MWVVWPIKQDKWVLWKLYQLLFAVAASTGLPRPLKGEAVGGSSSSRLQHKSNFRQTELSLPMKYTMWVA